MLTLTAMQFTFRMLGYQLGMPHPFADRKTPLVVTTKDAAETEDILRRAFEPLRTHAACTNPDRTPAYDILRAMPPSKRAARIARNCRYQEQMK